VRVLPRVRPVEAYDADEENDPPHSAMQPIPSPQPQLPVFSDCQPHFPAHPAAFPNPLPRRARAQKRAANVEVDHPCAHAEEAPPMAAPASGPHMSLPKLELPAFKGEKGAKAQIWLRTLPKQQPEASQLWQSPPASQLARGPPFIRVLLQRKLWSASNWSSQAWLSSQQAPVCMRRWLMWSAPLGSRKNQAGRIRRARCQAPNGRGSGRRRVQGPVRGVRCLPRAAGEGGGRPQVGREAAGRLGGAATPATDQIKQ
jgi:hypothetical protein